MTKERDGSFNFQLNHSLFCSCLLRHFHSNLNFIERIFFFYANVHFIGKFFHAIIKIFDHHVSLCVITCFFSSTVIWPRRWWPASPLHRMAQSLQYNEMARKFCKSFSISPLPSQLARAFLATWTGDRHKTCINHKS